MAGQAQRVRSAVIDGRAQTPRHIQKQLTQLYDALQKAQPAIQNAIRRDTDYSSAEADSEIFLTLKAVRQQYEAFNLEEFLDQEYSLAHAKDNLSRRVPVGCVYIIPSQHSRFYSIIQPACAAIAAGNCVMVEVSQTLSELGSLLRKIFAETMDRDTFIVVESKPADEELFSKHCVIVDSRAEPSLTASLQVLSSPPSRTVAIVDRTSIISEAARDIVRARFAFCGQSPYAPDLVLVNEFALKEFCSFAARYATEQFGSNMASGNLRKAKMETTSDLQKELQKSGARPLISGSSGSIVIVQGRESILLSRTIAEPVLLIHSIRSLDDAIDLANSRSAPLHATYLFAAPPAAKYLSQFIQARISFTNHVPTDLLIGPAAPGSSAPSVQARYTKEMFSIPSPEYITPSPQSSLLTRLLDKNDKETQAKIKAEMSTPLSPMNEPAGKAIAFFEQGLLTGGVVVLVFAITGLAFVVKYVGPAVMKRVR